MSCNCAPYIDAYGGTQTVPANDLVEFDAVNIESCNAKLENNALVIPNSGIYQISFNCNVVGDGNALTLELQNNGITIPRAISQPNFAAGTTGTVSISKLLHIRKSCQCINNTARITVKNTGENPASLTNVNLTMVRDEE